MSYSITTHMYDYMNDGKNFIKVLISYSDYFTNDDVHLKRILNVVRIFEKNDVFIEGEKYSYWNIFPKTKKYRFCSEMFKNVIWEGKPKVIILAK